MNKSMATVLLGAVLALAQPVGAHTDDYLDTIATPHGGQLRMAGPYHLELVAKDKELILYVTDHGDNPIRTDAGWARQPYSSARPRPGPRSSWKRG